MVGEERLDGMGIFVAEKWADSVVIVKRHSKRVLILKTVLDNGLLADHTIGRAFGTLCRLSVCRLSVTFCIVAKRYVLVVCGLEEPTLHHPHQLTKPVFSYGYIHIL